MTENEMPANDEVVATNGSRPDLPGESESIVLSPELVNGVLQQVLNQGFAAVPPEIATEIGQQAVAKVLANRQVDALMRENGELRKKIAVMETDMAVLHARLQEAGLEEAPIPEGAEVTPPDPFPGEPGGEAGDGEGDGASSEADSDAVTP